jgi:hypothetical protein
MLQRYDAVHATPTTSRNSAHNHHITHPCKIIQQSINQSITQSYNPAGGAAHLGAYDLRHRSAARPVLNGTTRPNEH